MDLSFFLSFFTTLICKCTKCDSINNSPLYHEGHPTPCFAPSVTPVKALVEEVPFKALWRKLEHWSLQDFSLWLLLLCHEKLVSHHLPALTPILSQWCPLTIETNPKRLPLIMIACSLCVGKLPTKRMSSCLRDVLSSGTGQEIGIYRWVG